MLNLTRPSGVSMSMATIDSPFLPRLVAILTFVGLLTANSAAAGGDPHHKTRVRSGTVQTQRGTAEFEQSIERRLGSCRSESAWTSARGGQGWAIRDRTRDREAGTVSSSTAVTRADGASATRNATAARTAEGTATLELSRSGFDGNTQTFSGTAERTDNGRRITGSAAGSRGGTAAILRKVERAGGSRTTTSSVTGPEGKTATSQSVWLVEGDGATRAVTTTFPDGEVHERQAAVTVDRAVPTPKP